MQNVPIPKLAPTVTIPAALFFVVVALLPLPVDVPPGELAPVADAIILEHVLAAAAFTV